MIQKNPSDAYDAFTKMIDDFYAQIVESDEQDLSVIAAYIREAADKLERPRVIDGGKSG